VPFSDPFQVLAVYLPAPLAYIAAQQFGQRSNLGSAAI
jgi:hypothetical protein